MLINFITVLFQIWSIRKKTASDSHVCYPQNERGFDRGPSLHHSTNLAPIDHVVLEKIKIKQGQRKA